MSEKDLTELTEKPVITPAQAERMLRLHLAIEKASKELDALKDLVKDAFPEDGTVVIGSTALKLSSTNRLNATKASKDFPVTEFPDMWEPKFIGLKAIPENKRPDYTSTSRSLSISEVKVS